MATNPENFDHLLKLLALKRYEQPPPGYFERSARQVTIRIRAGEAEQASWLDDLREEASLFHRVWSLLEARPVLAGAFGAAVSALLLVGIVYTQRPEQASTTAAAPPHDEFALAQPNPVAAIEPVASPLLASSTNPVPAGLFDGFRPPALRASWPPQSK